MLQKIYKILKTLIKYKDNSKNNSELNKLIENGEFILSYNKTQI